MVPPPPSYIQFECYNFLFANSIGTLRRSTLLKVEKNNQRVRPEGHEVELVDIPELLPMMMFLNRQDLFIYMKDILVMGCDVKGRCRMVGGYKFSFKAAMVAIGIFERPGQGLSESKLPRLAGGVFFFRAQLEDTHRFPPSYLCGKGYFFRLPD